MCVRSIACICARKYWYMHKKAMHIHNTQPSIRPCVCVYVHVCVCCVFVCVCVTTHIFTHAGMDRSLLEKGGWVMHVCSILLEQKDGTEQSVGSFPRS